MGQEQSTQKEDQKQEDGFDWFAIFQLQGMQGTKEHKEKDTFPSFEQHMETIRAVKNLCESSKKAQKPDKLALTIAKLPPLLREDALSYLTERERLVVLHALEKYFTIMFHNRLALMRKYNEERRQAEKRKDRINSDGHVLGDAFHQENITNYWEIFRNDNFKKFGLTPSEQRNVLSLWDELGNRGSSKEFTEKVFLHIFGT